MAAKQKSGKLAWTTHRKSTNERNWLKQKKRKEERVETQTAAARRNKQSPADKPWSLAKRVRFNKRHSPKRVG